MIQSSWIYITNFYVNITDIHKLKLDFILLIFMG